MRTRELAALLWWASGDKYAMERTVGMSLDTIVQDFVEGATPEERSRCLEVAERMKAEANNMREAREARGR